METSFLSLGLNIILMILLGAMIFYARRLSDSISVFRNSRKEMDVLIKDLCKNIDRAEAAIKSMRRETDTSADDLHFMITKARALSEELQFIQETGDRLATRLEQAVDKHSASRPSIELEEDDPVSVAKKGNGRATARKTNAPPPRPMFNIIDREYDAPEGKKSPSFDSDDDADMPDNLKSQAERDLAMALQRQKKEPERIKKTDVSLCRA